MWDRFDYTSNGREVDKCRARLSKYCKGVGLDIGCGSLREEKGYPIENKIVPYAIGVDKALTNIPSIAEDLHWFKDEVLDFVFSSHLLEHISDYQSCLKEWWRVLKDDGNLVLYLPHKHFYPQIHTGLGNPDHKHDFTPHELLLDMQDIGFFEVIHIEEHNEANEYSFDFVIRKI